MTGFEPRISVVGIDRSTNCDTNAAHTKSFTLLSGLISLFIFFYKSGP